MREEASQLRVRRASKEIAIKNRKQNKVFF